MSDEILVAFLGLLGVVLGLVVKIYLDNKAYRRERDAKREFEDEQIRKALQAELRHDLYESFQISKEKGGATIFERDLWNNMYDAYHNLGLNGVMDATKEEYFALPILKD